jgi:lysozyme family protein
MRDNFDQALAHIFREEGGLADDGNDPGGLTHFGITLPTLATYRGGDVRRADLLALTREEAGAIYRRLYWDQIRGDDLPSGLDLFLFDFAVNSGPRRAIKMIQSLVGTDVDGVIGPKTLAAIERHDSAETIHELYKARMKFLKSLSVWRYFGKGWTKRNDRIRKAALSWVLVKSESTMIERTLGMNDALEATKTALQSRTIWANMIGLASLGLSFFGYGALDVGGLTDAVLQTIAAGSFIASTLFRVTAKKRIVA